MFVCERAQMKIHLRYATFVVAQLSNVNWCIYVLLFVSMCATVARKTTIGNLTYYMLDKIK